MKVLLLLLLSLDMLFATYISDEKKLLMIVVEKQNCPWCHKLDKEVFSNPQVLAKLKKRFFITNITIESGNLPLFVHPKYFPTTFVYTQDGTELIDSLVGYRTKEKFLKFFDTSYDTTNDDF